MWTRLHGTRACGRGLTFFFLLVGIALPAMGQTDPLSVPYPTDTYFAAPNASAAVVTTLRRRGLEFSNIEPGKRLLWFATARERVRSMYNTIIRRKGVVRDEDNDGEESLDFAGRIPRSSVWVIVDPARNEVQVVSPQGMKGGTFEASAVQLGNRADRLLASGKSLDALWLRPNEGVWFAQFRDGGPNDDDGIGNREVRARLSDFKPQYPPDKPPPARAQTGDIFVLVTQPTQRVAIVEIDQ